MSNFRSVGQVRRALQLKEEADVLALKKLILEVMIEAAQELRAALDLCPDLPMALTPEQAAKLAGFSTKVFRALHRKGLVPGDMGVKPLRFSKLTIIEWTRKGRDMTTH